MTRIPEITTKELRAAINKLKKGKSPDSNGIRAEDVKACDDETREMVRQIFNDIIKRNEFTPEAWKKVKIKVIHKKGDVENVGNYRPICSLPALYKLFSTILYSRFFSTTRPKTSGRSSRIQKLIPDKRPPCDVQNDCAEMPRVENQNVDSNNRLHEGIRLHHTQINLESTQILQNIVMGTYSRAT